MHQFGIEQSTSRFELVLLLRWIVCAAALGALVKGEWIFTQWIRDL